MSHVPNYSVLNQELVLAREIALPTFPVWEDEIYQVFELANELIMSLWSIDRLIGAMEFNQAIRTGEKFIVLADRLFSLEPHIKRLFTSPDKLVSWRRSPTDNILEAIENEARDYCSYFRSFLSYDSRVDEEVALSSLRSQIKQRAAKDDNQDPIRWSNYRQPKEWRRLRKLKGLSNSVNIWPKLCRDNPQEIQCESTQNARISFELARSWGLDLPEFQT